MRPLGSSNSANTLNCSAEAMAQIITEVTVQRSNCGDTSYPREFCLPCGKKGWGQRQAIKCLDQCVKTEHFKIYLLSDLLQSQDWIVKMDLKDAHLQVSIHSGHEHLL